MSAFFVSLLFFGQIFAQNGTATAPAALSAIEKQIADKITVATIKEYTNALAAPEMEGRGTMQPGGDKAANWIADRFQKMGLKPLGERSGYLQKIEFKESVAATETMFQIGEEKLQHGTDFALLPMNNGNKDVSGEMVFAAFGIVAD